MPKKEKLDAETRFYQILIYAKIISQITMVAGFFIIFFLVLHLAGLV